MAIIDTRSALLMTDPLASMSVNQEREQFELSETFERAKANGQDPHIAYEINAPPLPPETLLSRSQEVDENELLQNTEWDDSEVPFEYATPEQHWQQPGVLFNRAAGTVHDWFYQINDYEHLAAAKYGMRVPKGSDWNVTGEFVSDLEPNRPPLNPSFLAQNDAERSQFGLEWIGHLMYSDVGMLGAFMQSDENTPREVLMAQAALMDVYEKLPSFTFKGSTRMFKNLVMNPSTFAGLGSLKVFKNLLVAGGKGGVGKNMYKRLLSLGLGATGIAAEGAGWAGFATYIDQKVKHGSTQERGAPFEANWGQIGAAAAVGFSLAGGLTFGIAAAPLARHGARKLRQTVQDMAAEGGATTRMGVGPTDTVPPGAAPDRTTFTLERFDAPRGASVRSKNLVTRIKEHPEVIDEVSTLVRQGEEVGRKWYDTEELRTRMIGELGEETGGAAWREFMWLVGATSTGAKVPTNIRVGSHYFTLGEKELNALADELLAGDYKPPKGYGHKMQRHHSANVGKVTTGQWGPEGDPTLNPKPRGFAQSLTGGTQNIAADVHFMRLMGKLSDDPQFLHGSAEIGQDFVKQLREKFGKKIDKFLTQRKVKDKVQYNFNAMKAVREGPKGLFEFIKDKPTIWSDMPNKNEYKIFEQLANEMAKELNMTAPQFQAALWMGAGKRTGVAPESLDTFMGIFNRNLELRAKERGITPEEVFKRFVNRTEPLFVPLAAAGGAVSQMTEEES